MILILFFLISCLNKSETGKAETSQRSKDNLDEGNSSPDHLISNSSNLNDDNKDNDLNDHDNGNGNYVNDNLVDHKNNSDNHSSDNNNTNKFNSCNRNSLNDDKFNFHDTEEHVAEEDFKEDHVIEEKEKTVVVTKPSCSDSDILNIVTKPLNLNTNQSNSNQINNFNQNISIKQIEKVSTGTQTTEAISDQSTEIIIHVTSTPPPAVPNIEGLPDFSQLFKPVVIIKKGKTTNIKGSAPDLKADFREDLKNTLSRKISKLTEKEVQELEQKQAERRKETLKEFSSENFCKGLKSKLLNKNNQPIEKSS